MYKLREYQSEIADKGVKILRSKMILYLAMAVRTGKSATALEVARLYGAKNVLFLTKKKAIDSITEDYHVFGFNKHFILTVINNESMHKLADDYDLVIHDESHRFGSFPKPSQGAKIFAEKFSNKPIILLSGTPTPESFSQIYHQFWVSKYSPFGESNFYKWAKNYVDVYQKNLGYGLVNFYEKADEQKIRQLIDPYMVFFTQKDAGFTSEVNENVLYCKMADITYTIANRLKKDLVIQGVEETIMADTAVKLMSKLHQIYSGTIKFDSGKYKVLDTTKANFIKEKFHGKKIGIFYKFKAELMALQDVFKDELTNDIDEFNLSSKNIALQIVSGREGISLSNADCLVYYNLDYSATSYWQSRDRLTTMDRLINTVYYVFSEGGIEPKIYKSVLNKRSYTSNHFIKDHGIIIPKKDNTAV